MQLCILIPRACLVSKKTKMFKKEMGLGAKPYLRVSQPQQRGDCCSIHQRRPQRLDKFDYSQVL